MRIFTAILLASGALFVGCGDSSSGMPSASASSKPTAAPPPATSTPATATAPAPTASATSSVASKPLAANAVDLAPMTLALEPPAGLNGTAQPAGSDVIVRFKGHEVSLTISTGHGDLAHEKKRVEGEKGFTKWDYEKDDVAIAEIEVDHAREYMGFTVKKIGDSLYECSTLTMKRPTSPNEAAVKEAVAYCNGLRAK